MVCGCVACGCVACGCVACGLLCSFVIWWCGGGSVGVWRWVGMCVGAWLCVEVWARVGCANRCPPEKEETIYTDALNT